jgi:acid phosphatase class B
VVGDYPGHCKVLEMMGAGARFGCTKCMTRGEYIAKRMVYHNYRHLLPEGHDFLSDPEFGKPIEPTVAPEMKTKELVEQLVDSVSRSGEPITGVKGHASGHAHNNNNTINKHM